MNNYIICGHSAIGKAHQNEGSKCQDNYCFCSKDNIIVAAVADGVSSSKKSDVASRIAVKVITNYCLNINKIYWLDSPNKIINKIKEGFNRALYKISQLPSYAPNDYATTLTVAVVIKDTLYFGQIGDSGIIALREDGFFERVTEEQNVEGVGKDRPVCPLSARSKWTFGKYKHKIKAIFLATDGVLNKLKPSLLEDQQYNLNHNYLCYLFNKIYCNSDESATLQWIQNEVANMPPEEVNYDDKSLVVVINKKSLLKLQSKEYYQFPTDELWKQLILENEKRLYPYRQQAEIKSTDKKIELKEKLNTKYSLNNSEVTLTNNSHSNSLKQSYSSEKEKHIIHKTQPTNLEVILGLCVVLDSLLILLLVIWRFPVL